MRNRLYLDYAAATPVDPAVTGAMLPYIEAHFGNPGSLHSFGQQASAAVFTARQMVAKELNCHYSEVIFTGSATEANNLAIRGALKAYRAKHPANRPRIIISAIEHDSVLATAQDIEREGVEVVIVPVSKEGVVDLKKLKAALNERTVIVSVMYANNEIGAVQPVAALTKVVREFRGDTQYPLLHTDAVQAFQYYACDVQELGVDLLTLSAQKIYGPKGVGALYVRRTIKFVTRLYPIQSLITGGGQEFDLRSGTENVAAIVGFAKAVSLAAMEREDESVRVAKLRDEAWRGVKKVFPKAELNGPTANILTFSRKSECARLPNNLNFYIPGVSGEQLVVALDLHGVAVSSGSACAARSIDPSHVVLALGHGAERAKNSVRVSLGRFTTSAEIRQFFKKLAVVKESL